MLGDDNSTAFLDNNALIGSGSDVPGFHTMARVTARAVVKAATATVTEAETATETSVLREQIDFILDNEYSHLMVAFAIATGLAALVSIATIFNVVRSFSKVKASMPPPGDGNGHATAKLMLLGKIEGSVDLLSIAFAVQALTFLSALLASRSLMENTVTIFEEKEADMAVNEWDPKL
ncbi:hypothetical protein FPRO05_09668 [Fusarium proliferatum]|uniref:Uncharacterized protein n=1 Tax=Gibberella intermedia TaxID=948311 RepID=A0A365NFI6_GIBIN|nr:hypothetical protein FPRO05_09668 [Fusarium proliferatum]